MGYIRNVAGVGKPMANEKISRKGGQTEPLIETVAHIILKKLMFNI